MEIGENILMIYGVLEDFHYFVLRESIFFFKVYNGNSKQQWHQVGIKISS